MGCVHCFSVGNVVIEYSTMGLWDYISQTYES